MFSVLRAQSFAGHSLADIATTGGSAAFLVGISQFWGFLVAGIAASATMEAIGVQRRRGRDVATGVVLGAALGLAALFLYLGTQQTSTTGASFSILFGSIFVVSPDTVPALVAPAWSRCVVIAAARPRLLLTAISPDLARARGVNVRLTGIVFLMALAVTVSLSAVAIGAVLSTALLIGPAATALRVTKSPGRAMVVSALIGLAGTWLGIVLAYESYYWPPHGHGWPVWFFVVVLVLAGYLLTYVRPRQRPVPRSPHEEGADRVRSCRRPDVHRPDGQHLDRREHRRGDRGDDRVLRGAARSTFAAHAIPNGAFAGAAGAALLGINVIWGLAVFAVGGALGIGALGARAAGARRGTTW